MHHLTNIRFDDFTLDTRLRLSLADAGFEYCTPIQAETLPLALAGRDIAGQAQTGTGKTLAFTLATSQRLLTHAPPPNRTPQQPRALMISPTRELAVQIHRDVALLAAHTDLRPRVVYGGTGYQAQRNDITQGVDILIGTPGRLIDYYQQGIFDLSSVEVVVVDEADRMFDLGFIKDIRYLLRRLPKPEKRQGLLFSATLSYRVTELAYEHMNNPVSVAIKPNLMTANQVRQRCYMTANDEKIPFLISLLRRSETFRTLIFINTKRVGERVWGVLESNGIPAGLLTGDVPQKQRLRLLRDFQDGTLPVLVATDVAARGLHIPEVSHVVNFDLPEDPEDYVHRIGRTARAGASGEAMSLVCETYALCLPDIEAFIGHSIEVGKVEENDLAVNLNPPARISGANPRPRQENKSGTGRQLGQRPKKRAPKPRSPPQTSTASGVLAASVEPSSPLTAPPITENAAATTKKRRRRRSTKAGANSQTIDAPRDQEPHTHPSPAGGRDDEPM